jgi:hypothetical protein
MTRNLFGGPKNTDGRSIFRFMKLEELMAGEDSELEETCFELAGTHFTIGKNKIPMKIPKFKMSGIGLIAEFSRILSGFPNQGSKQSLIR